MSAMDWKSLIQELVASGMTQQQIAAKCGVTQSTISDLANKPGMEPKFKTGAALIALAKRKPKGAQ